MSHVRVLDGGMSNALADRGHDLSGSLWTARLLRDAPSEIAAVHEAYFRAGAQIATTASYQASEAAYVAAGLTLRAARELITASVLVARQVRDELAADGVARQVAASVGPYGATLADGSEYRGQYGLTARQLWDFHAPRLELLAAGEPDLIAVETIPDIDEAEVLVGLLDELGWPTWFSFTVDGSRTRAGQPLAEAFAVAGSARSVIAIGINCCRPADVLPAVELAVKITERPAVAYPNRGELWDAGRKVWTGVTEFDAGLAADWVAAGAEYVGGCCRVGPSDIAAIAAVVADQARTQPSPA